MGKYAERATTPVHQTRNEIERLFERFGAERWAHFQESDKAVLVFFVNDIPYKFSLVVDKSDEKRLWRCLFASIKGRLIAVEEGIETFEQAFIGHVALKGGRTVSETFSDQLPALSASDGTYRLALPGGEK